MIGRLVCNATPNAACFVPFEELRSSVGQLATSAVLMIRKKAGYAYATLCPPTKLQVELEQTLLASSASLNSSTNLCHGLLLRAVELAKRKAQVLHPPAESKGTLRIIDLTLPLLQSNCPIVISTAAELLIAIWPHRSDYGSDAAAKFARLAENTVATLHSICISCCDKASKARPGLAQCKRNCAALWSTIVVRIGSIALNGDPCWVVMISISDTDLGPPAVDVVLKEGSARDIIGIAACAAVLGPERLLAGANPSSWALLFNLFRRGLESAPLPWQTGSGQQTVPAELLIRFASAFDDSVARSAEASSARLQFLAALWKPSLGATDFSKTAGLPAVNAIIDGCYDTAPLVRASAGLALGLLSPDVLVGPFILSTTSLKAWTATLRLTHAESSELRSVAVNAIACAVASWTEQRCAQVPNEDGVQTSTVLNAEVCPSRAMELGYALMVARWHSEPALFTELLNEHICIYNADRGDEKASGNGFSDGAPTKGPEEFQSHKADARLFEQDTYTPYAEYDVTAAVASVALQCAVASTAIPNATWESVRRERLPAATKAFEVANQELKALGICGVEDNDCEMGTRTLSTLVQPESKHKLAQAVRSARVLVALGDATDERVIAALRIITSYGYPAPDRFAEDVARACALPS